MRPWTPLAFGIVVSVVACGEGRPFGGDSGGSDASMGDARSCASNADCNDNTPCTTDRCLVGGVCENAADNTMCTAPMVCVSGRGCVAPSARPCTAPSDCDDRIACTRDTCLVEGVCRNQPDDTMCPMGQVCNATSGCGTTATRCMSAADCDDHVACTEDTCGVDGRCVHVPQNMRCMAGQTCNATMGCVVTRACESDMQCDNMVYCDGMERCSTELACVAGMPVNCDDMDPCTRDACDETMRACTHTREPSCMGMMPRTGIYSITPRAMYQCMDSIFSMVVVSFDLMSLNIVSTSGGLTVSGMGIPTMTGPAPTATGMFTVRGTRAGDCNENYELSGTFSSPTMFTATFRVSFAGSTCSLTDCTMQSFMVTGTATM